MQLCAPLLLLNPNEPPALALHAPLLTLTTTCCPCGANVFSDPKSSNGEDIQCQRVRRCSEDRAIRHALDPRETL